MVIITIIIIYMLNIYIIIHLPFKIGHSFDIAPMGPRFENWPMANSKYSKGIPQNIITKKYGIKNTPKNILNTFSNKLLD